MRMYGGEHDVTVGDALLADDGYYYVVGTVFTQWEPEMQGDILLLKLDPAGEVVWQRTYGGDGFDTGQSIAQTSAGELLIAGGTRSFSDGDMDGYLMLVDREGAELWSQTYGGPLDEMVGAQQLPDGGYILGGNIVDPNDIVTDPGAAGYGGFEGRANICAFRVDEDGDEIWSQAFDSEDNIMAVGGVQMPDGGFLAMASIIYFPDDGDDILLVKLDADGNMEWSRIFDEGHTNAYEIIPTSDGNYLITGSYRSMENTDDQTEDYLFIKIDSDGNELWRSTFGDPDMIDYGVALDETADGGFVTVAEVSADHYTGDVDLEIVKIDEDGEFVWEQPVPVDSHTMLRSIIQNPDGGFFIAGATFDGSGFSLLFVKTDAEGLIAED
jgi:outer membrane protein assembly factor BamB